MLPHYSPYVQVINAQLSKKLAAAGLPYVGGIPADPTIGTAR